MKAPKSSNAHKTYFVKRGQEDVLVAEICRIAGINHATYFNWKKKYGGLSKMQYAS